MLVRIAAYTLTLLNCHSEEGFKPTKDLLFNATRKPAHHSAAEKPQILRLRIRKSGCCAQDDNANSEWFLKPVHLRRAKHHHQRNHRDRNLSNRSH